MAKKSEGWSKVLLNLLLVIPSIFNIARHLVSCLECELRQAKRGLITLFVLALIALALMVGFWMCLCAATFLWLHVWFGDIGALVVLLLSHLVLLLVIGIWMAKAKNKLLFSHTREIFRN